MSFTLSMLAMSLWFRVRPGDGFKRLKSQAEVPGNVEIQFSGLRQSLSHSVRMGMC